jgi:transcriptional regulator with XRE-family HTH domain
MRNRIIQFIEREGITPSEFADKIGIQRSSLSHVLNGRNNPGFSFIQKILDAYPSLNSRWLLTGAGEMSEKEALPKSISAENLKPKQPAELSLFPENRQNQDVLDQPKIQPQKEENLQKNLKNETTTNVKIPIDNAKNEMISIEKKVVRVLLFYNDHTFEDFRPSE